MPQLYVLGTIVFAVLGQYLIKAGVRTHQLPEGASEKIIFLLKLVFTPQIFIGLGLGFISALFWIAAMTKLDLTYAYPLLIAGLIVTTVAMAVLLLGESIDLWKVAGVALIAIGVLLMNKSGFIASK